MFKIFAITFLFYTSSVFATFEEISESIKSGDLKKVDTLIKSEVYTPAESASLLQSAITERSVDALKLLLDAGLNPNYVKNDGFNATALMFAAYINNTEMMGMLVKAGAKIDTIDEIGDPAINWAAYAGNIDAVKWLVDRDARLDLVGHGTALEIAMRRGFSAIVDMLCIKLSCHKPSADAIALMSVIDDPQIALPNYLTSKLLAELDNTGRPLIHRASRLGRLDILKATVLSNVIETPERFIDLTDRIGYTPLMEASREGKTEVIEWLFENGADPSKVGSANGLGLSAIHLAALSGQMDTVKLLAKLGADLDAQDRDGSTAAMWALSVGLNDIVMELVNLGADTTIKNNSGYSLPIDF